MDKTAHTAILVMLLGLALFLAILGGLAWRWPGKRGSGGLGAALVLAALVTALLALAWYFSPILN